MSELVIKGGTVVDGTGAPGIRADVAIDGDRVVAIGPDLTGDRVLDATGCIVAPGFVDIHTHYDAQVFWDPALTPSCFHGVTTVIAGNCGFTIAPTRAEHRNLIARTLEKVEDMDVEALTVGVPWDQFESFPEYLGAVERGGLGLNFGAYIGHTALRIYVMGEAASDRQATPEELDEMRRIIGEALDAGAVGFASSFAPTHQGADGRPIPSRVADVSELMALFGVLRDKGVGTVGVTAGGTFTPDRLYEIQPELGRPITYTALLANPTGSHRRLLQLNEDGWEQGAQVWPQVSPRALSFSMTLVEPFTLNVNPEFSALMSGTIEERVAAYADPAFRTAALEAWTTMPMKPRWDTFRVAETETYPELIGRPLTEIAAERDSTPFDALMDLATVEPTMRVSCFVANDDPVEVEHLLLADHCALGLSDAGAHVGQLCDAPQATDYLGNWVRDKQLLSIEEAVRRLTSQQADLFGLSDRGRLAVGLPADVVVFDAETVAPGPIRRVADFPAGTSRLTADQPTGVRHVVVNGTPIRVDGVQDTTLRPGRLVRPS